MIVMRLRLVLFILLAALPTSPTFAADEVAPLPPGMAPSGATKVRGVYADEGRFGDSEVEQRIKSLKDTCAARGIQAQIDGEAMRWQRTKQIYRSTQSVAVHQARPEVKVDEARCIATVTLRRWKTVATGPWSRIKPKEWGDGIPPCVEGRRSLMRCTRETVLDIEAICVNSGGFDGFVRCESARDDLSKGLTLRFATYTDLVTEDGDGQTEWSLSRVSPDVLIDPVVFKE